MANRRAEEGTNKYSEVLSESFYFFHQLTHRSWIMNDIIIIFFHIELVLTVESMQPIAIGESKRLDKYIDSMGHRKQNLV